MLVAYDENFDDRRNELAQELQNKYPDMDPREAQEKARLILLTEKSDVAHKRPRRSREELLEAFALSGQRNRNITIL